MNVPNTNYAKVTALVSLIVVLNSCINTATNTHAGYQGAVTDSQATMLQGICHFMPKDTIATWVARYTAYKKMPEQDSATVANLIMDSCSFNNNIVRAIITNDSCIGLRILNGMDEQNKVHIILVGIKPDYSTLYIKKPADCGQTTNNDQAKGKPVQEVGGGEMSSIP